MRRVVAASQPLCVDPLLRKCYELKNRVLRCLTTGPVDLYTPLGIEQQRGVAVPFLWNWWQGEWETLSKKIQHKLVQTREAMYRKAAHYTDWMRYPCPSKFLVVLPFPPGEEVALRIQCQTGLKNVCGKFISVLFIVSFN